MLLHHSKTSVRYVNWAAICLMVLFLALSTHKPAVGLSGLGGVLILWTLLIEANAEQIWQDYTKQYKKTKHSGLAHTLNRPSRLWYGINVYIAFPILFLIGLGSIYAAYLIS